LTEELVQFQLVVKFASQPTATPLTRPAKFHLINPDVDNGSVVLLNLAFCGHQRHGASHLLPLIENLDTPAPSYLLLVVDLAQIQDMSLDNSALGYTPVLNQTPIVMLLAILFARAASQKHDGARL
jgi:hypothetical protein